MLRALRSGHVLQDHIYSKFMSKNRLFRWLRPKLFPTDKLACIEYIISLGARAQYGLVPRLFYISVQATLGSPRQRRQCECDSFVVLHLNILTCAFPCQTLPSSAKEMYSGVPPELQSITEYNGSILEDYSIMQNTH